jgi:hypothetical protein
VPYLALLALGAAIATAVGYAKSRAHGGTFDVHLPPAFEASVLHALKIEKNPEKLATFGQSLIDDYPIAAGVLLTRARNITAGSTVGGFRRHIGNTDRPGRLQRTREEANEAQRVAAALANDPQLAKLPPPALARRLHVRLPVVQAVLLSAKPAGHGIVVDPQTLTGYVGEPSPPKPVDRKAVELAIAAARGKPAAQRVMSYLRTQNPDSTRAAERMVAQALWAKKYKEPSS